MPAPSYRRVYLGLLAAGLLALALSLGIGFGTADACPRDASGLTAKMVPAMSAEERAAMNVYWVDDLIVAHYTTSPYSSLNYSLGEDFFGDCRPTTPLMVSIS